MITFKRIRYKNFIAVGNQFIEIDLDTNNITLCHGINGSGKSQIIDAICYVLFNKAYRNINLPQLINNVNKKQLLVELEFSISDREYMIRRGMKPTIFEIYQDGSLINQSSANKDYQEMLEKNILGMNEKTFRQIVVLGSANFIPFMQLSPAARREIIEDLLDIQVFSIMNNLLKERISKNKDEVNNIINKIELQETKIKLNKKHIEEIRQNNEELIKSKQTKINELKDKEKHVLSDIDEILLENEKLNKKIEKSVKRKLDEILGIKLELEKKQKPLAKEKSFYENTHICPTCDQQITENFIKDKLLVIETKQRKLKDKLAKLEPIISEYQDSYKQEEAIKSSIQKNNNRYTELIFEVDSIKKIINANKKDIEELQARNNSKDNPTIEEQLISERETLAVYFEDKKKLLEERETYSIASSLLKDGGIKSVIIKQYIPLINKTINNYLKILDFHDVFVLDETFKESIMTPGKENRNYNSFSEGEKMRIDLSILFAWRAIAKARNSAATNLLILDEIFDSALDYDGMDGFAEMLKTLTTNTNTFIITPKPDYLIDKVDNVIEFKKIKNFTKMVSNSEQVA